MRTIRSCGKGLKLRVAAAIKGIVLLGLIAIPAVVCAQSPPPAASQQVAATKLIDGEVDVSIEPEVRGFIASNAFDRVAVVHDRYLTQRSKTAGGQWKSEILGKQVLARLADRDGSDGQIDWSAAKALTSDLARSAPDSAMARMLHARVLVRQAIEATTYDFGPVSYTKSKRQPERDELLRRTVAYLESEKAVASRDPEFYAIGMRIALLQNDDAQLERVFNQATAKFPDYYPLYSLRLGDGYGIKRLNGDGVERFARRVMRRNPAGEGRALYARIYSDYAENYLLDQESLFVASQAKWADMKAGFEDLVERYPDQRNLQTYAKFACFAGNSFQLYVLLQRMPAPLREVWDRQSRFDACNELGMMRVPYVV